MTGLTVRQAHTATRMAMNEYLGYESWHLLVIEGDPDAPYDTGTGNVVNVWLSATPDERRAYWRAKRLLSLPNRACEDCWVNDTADTERTEHGYIRHRCDHVGTPA